MPSGSRRRSGDEYVFVDGRAVLARDVRDASVPGQAEARRAGAVAEPSPAEEAREQGLGEASPSREGARRAAFFRRESRSASDVVPAVASELLLDDDRRSLRRKCVVCGAVLLALTLFSLCVSDGYFWRIYSPADVAECYGAWFQIAFTGITDPVGAERLRFDTIERLPMYTDVIYTVLVVFKYLACGILLAVSGMLYQNTFRNPIAAPSMLGVSNGINVAILVLVMQFGYNAMQMMGLYYAYSYIGGALVLAFVMIGGKIISGKGNFNVVNMLLIGTIVSQLLGVVLAYVQNMFMDESAWDAYYLLQTATGLDTAYTYLSLLIGGVAAFIPIFIFRFRLNLVAFDDAEVRMLGVNADALRMMALVCGSIMILTAQINAGQVAMLSLVVPFIVRAVFGSEFRKQLIGNILCGGILMLVAGDVVSYIAVSEISLDVGSVVTICAMPLFVWMIAVRQRTWE